MDKELRERSEWYRWKSTSQGSREEYSWRNYKKNSCLWIIQAGTQITRRTTKIRGKCKQEYFKQVAAVNASRRKKVYKKILNTSRKTKHKVEDIGMYMTHVILRICFVVHGRNMI